MLKIIRISSWILPLLMLNSVWAYNCSPEYDSLGIPHQQTSSQEELFYCFGYHHGHDRAWEMDFLRRVAQGRNAEVLGFSHLKSDLMMRLLDLPGKAKKLWTKFPEDQKKWLQLYADGANAGFKTGQGAQEFLDLNYVPEEWLPADTITVLLTQSFDQTRKTFFREYKEQLSWQDWGGKAEKLFDQNDIPWENTILKKGEYPKKSSPSKRITSYKKKAQLWGDFPTIFGEESGSNSWVISAKKSKTGKAILANDPHLDLKTPLFWYWIHLKSPNGELIGGSLPGVPVVASGTNGKVAWGLTNAYINTADAVFLKEPKDELFETIRPLVWVKLGFFKIPFFFKSFQRLKTGQPVLPLETDRDEKMVLRWTGFTLSPDDILPMLDFIKVKNVSEMDKLLQKVGVPAWNFVFADVNGNIGYRMVGRSYRNNEESPFGVPTETVEKFLEKEYLEAHEVPNLLRPAREYVYTANNRHWPQDATFHGGRGYSHSFRGFRIDELLEGKHDSKSFGAIQCDTQVVDARFFLPKILQYISSPALASWKLQARDSSGELSLYRRLMDIMMEEWKIDEYALFRMLDKLDEKQHKEIKEFYEQAAIDVSGRKWGEFHRINFVHLSNDERWIFSPEIAGIGDNHTVNPGTSRWNHQKRIYQQFSGASMRMIIEMSERPKILLGLPGLNREYDKKSALEPWSDWRECKYSEVTF